MRHTTISRLHVGLQKVGGTFWIVAAFWMVAGIVAVIPLAGGLTRLAVALAIVTTEWWILSEVEHRVDRNDAKMAAMQARMRRNGLRPAARARLPRPRRPGRGAISTCRAIRRPGDLTARRRAHGLSGASLRPVGARSR
jgi:hypothetical protein